MTEKTKFLGLCLGMALFALALSFAISLISEDPGLPAFIVFAVCGVFSWFILGKLMDSLSAALAVPCVVMSAVLAAVVIKLLLVAAEMPVIIFAVIIMVVIAFMAIFFTIDHAERSKFSKIFASFSVVVEFLLISVPMFYYFV